MACALGLIAAGTALFQFLVHLRAIDAHRQSAAPEGEPVHYRPMLRLLSEADAALITDPVLRRKMRLQRVAIFREYLRLLTGDYGRLLAAVRLVMSQSAVDRPDLAKALLRNRVLFAIALCRIDIRLRLFALGIGKPGAVRLDVLRLVDALDALRRQAALLTDSAVWGT